MPLPLPRFGIVQFMRQHLPVPSAPTLPDAPAVTHVTPTPESAALHDNPLSDAAFDVGIHTLDLGKGAAMDGLADAASKDDPPDTPDWLWDRNPFEPGLQLTSDPLAADVSGDLVATELALPDLPDLPGDGLDTVFG